ncbi:hypothetical protein TNCV_4981701 [Trichonephila clavipes]|nr:hypothetical protein TNCV_4981701 [Trichonephila clavipes]
MGVEPGEFSVSAMKLLDRERLMKAIYAFSGRSKKIRKDKRRKRKKEEDNIKKNKNMDESYVRRSESLMGNSTLLKRKLVMEVLVQKNWEEV